MFIVSNNFVLGGTSGLAVIFNQIFQIKPVITIYVFSFLLLIIGFLTLPFKETRRAIIGTIIYPLFISLTSPLVNVLMPYFKFDNILIVVLIAAMLQGLGTGLIYKVGFNTGGGDILVKIISRYFEFTEGNSSLISNSIVLLCGILVFGVNTIVYSIIILIIMTELIDRILIGISDCKMFFIYSKKYKDIEKFIINDLETGVTLFNTEGAYKKEKREMLMVVVSTRDYYRVKQHVLSIDNEAFFVVSDCYEVNGGIRRKNLPFI